MLACSGRRDSGPAATAPGWLSFSLSKTCVASSSSSQSMFSFAPLGDVGLASGMAAAVAGIEPVDGPLESAAGPGRVLAGGGGTWLWTFVAGACDGEPTAGTLVWLGELLVGGCTACRFGSEPRPGGGGGFDGCAARVEPDCGGDDGSGGGCDTRPDGGPAEGEDGIADADVGGVDGGIAGRLLPLGGWAGPGIPMSVFFMSPCAYALAAGAAGICDAELGAPMDPGGGGGTADVRGELFLPRPSKMSRSEPLLLSSDIRVS